ncbi:phage major capsid protein [Pyruvatibacter mobilis]|uniref:phage major capsid protein n=1 Tax=Pyruvatibacter mobilis TaxID=1712261 RepID=UPI003BACABCC
MSGDLKETIEQTAKAVSEMRETFTTQMEEIKKSGVADPLLADKVDKLADTVNGLEGLQKSIEEEGKLAKRVGELEADLETIRKGKDPKTGAVMAPEQKAHLDAFETWFKNRDDPAAAQALLDIQKKTVSTLSDPSGGYAVPEVISTSVREKLQDFSPLRQIVDVMQYPSSDYAELVDVNGESYEWVGQGDPRNQQTEPQLAEAKPAFGTVNAYYWANEEAMDDMFFNVQAWLSRSAVRSFAKAEGVVFVSGNGIKKPKGIMASSPVATGDEDSPARAFGVLQYIATGVAHAAGAPFGRLSNTSPYFYPDAVFSAAYSALKTGYKNGAVWLMNRGTIGEVMKLRDADGKPLYQASLVTGVPSTILGHPVIEFPDMPDVGTNAHPIAFGNFREGYMFGERHGMRLTVNEVTDPGRVKFNFRRRVGGGVRNDDAIKMVKQAAS